MQQINPWRKIYDLPQSTDPYTYGKPDFALYLDVEPTNGCTFNCLFCARQQMKRPIGYMDLDLYKEICKQAKEYGAHGIRLLRWGEPLLHKQIDEFVKIAKEHSLCTHITTNGMLLDDKMIIRLIESGIDTIIISLQGTNKDEYNKVRNTDKYDVVSNNIKRLVEIRDELKVDNPYVHISTTITDETVAQVKDWERYWSSIVDSTGWGYTWFKRLKDKTKVQDLIDRSKKLPHNFKCIEVMNKLSIDWDGTVSPCCLDYDQQLTIGNIKDNNLMELWKSPQAEAIRTLLGQKRQDLFTLCSGCELNYDFRGKK